MMKFYKKIKINNINEYEPVYIANSDDMRKMDEHAVKILNISFTELMEIAAKSAFACISEYINFNKSDFQNMSIVILCGTGNNGGDGYVLGKLFADSEYSEKSVTSIAVLNISDKPPRSEAALFHYNRLNSLKGLKNSNDIKILSCIELSDENLQEIFFGSDIIIDAVFGTGFKGALEGEALRVIKFANDAHNHKANKNKLRIAVDVPSGVDCDSGKASAYSFEADMTLTFEFIKRGLVSYPGAEYAGEVVVVPIGFTQQTREIINKHSILLSPDYIKNIFDNRRNKRKFKNTNKGDFGKLLAICGSENMTGAAYLSAMGALRTGVGLLYLASDRKIMPVLQSKLNEPVFIPLDYNYNNCYDNNAEQIINILSEDAFDSVLIGPGLGLENGEKIISSLKKINYSNHNHRAKTIIFDADGINALCGNINILHEVKVEKILTPHPGEMLRLCRAAGFDIKSVSDVQEDRMNISAAFAEKYNCILVLKGAGTVIAAPNGDIYINSTGNPGMSKGGSGDILAGMIASYCAQGIKPTDSACLAVYFHGMAGDIAAERYSETGMIPSDMLNILAEIQK